jgi:Uma2 family endonuclease
MVIRPSIYSTPPPQQGKHLLPTMYDLPSEDPEEPGLPDEFHYHQPHLLSATLRITTYPPEQVFCVGDMNVYYDVHHPLWHKCPDWFLVVGVSRFYEERDLRLSYVIWQEEVSPFLVVELLSPRTEKEDLGEIETQAGQPPPKWEVYEQILRIPYYVVFNRYVNQLRVFQLIQNSYQELDVSDRKLWIPELNVGLGLWQGHYRGFTRPWLRWYDSSGNWLPTDIETTEQEHQRAEQEHQRAEQAEQEKAQLIELLRAKGIDPD